MAAAMALHIPSLPPPSPSPSLCPPALSHPGIPRALGLLSRPFYLALAVSPSPSLILLPPSQHLCSLSPLQSPPLRLPSSTLPCAQILLPSRTRHASFNEWCKQSSLPLAAHARPTHATLLYCSCGAVLLSLTLSPLQSPHMRAITPAHRCPRTSSPLHLPLFPRAPLPTALTFCHPCAPLTPAIHE